MHRGDIHICTGKRGDGALAVGILYESDEWSDHKLEQEIGRALSAHGLCSSSVTLIDMQSEGCLDKALACNVLISRVFASAMNRGHLEALGNMELLLDALNGKDVLLVNEAKAHAYEIDKVASTVVLGDAGIPVPQIYQFGMPRSIQLSKLVFPCVVKPVCSGRTTETIIAHNEQEVRMFLKNASQRDFLVEEYIAPQLGFITRVEIIGGNASLIVKRSIAGNGLSAYRFGSTYEPYDDASPELVDASERAAEALGFAFGSFDIIETPKGNYFIDANSVSNVSEDCTEMFQRDLLKEHAEEIVRMCCEFEDCST